MKEILKNKKQNRTSSAQNPQDISKVLNKFFTSFGPKLAKKIPDTEKNILRLLRSHDEKIQFEELNFDKLEKHSKV